MRILLLDQLRGLAIFLMVIFHFCYDLWYFEILRVDFFSVFWEWFRYLIVTLFLIVSGYSMTLGGSNSIRWSQWRVRLFQVSLSALIITLVTYLIFPNYWIYFGILHFFAVSMIVLIPFRTRPVFSITLGLAIFVLFHTTSWFNLSPLYAWLKPILNLPTGTQDLTRFIPWFGMILIGSGLSHFTLKFFTELNSKHWHQTRIARALTFIGQHPLKIYLLHQPILFGLVLISVKYI